MSANDADARTDALLGVIAATDLGDRHETLFHLTAKIHAIIVGSEAKRLLANPESLPDMAGLWATPSWVWLHSRVNVGRKDRASDGSRLRLPVRVAWQPGPIALITPGPRSPHQWTACGLGYTGTDTIHVGASQTLLDPVVLTEKSGLPVDVTVPLLSHFEIVAALEGLVLAGKNARWEALEYLEPYATRALTLAHSNVAKELSEQWGTQIAVLDETKLETIRDQMLLGDTEHPGKIAQLLDRCLKPETFKRAEPIKYIKESLRRDANEQVRRAIGDPHIGPKARRVFREIGPGNLTSLDQLVEEYRNRYPKDRLSRDRAVAALSVAPDAMASWSEEPLAIQSDHRVDDRDSKVTTVMRSLGCGDITTSEAINALRLVLNPIPWKSSLRSVTSNTWDDVVDAALAGVIDRDQYRVLARSDLPGSPGRKPSFDLDFGSTEPTEPTSLT